MRIWYYLHISISCKFFLIILNNADYHIQTFSLFQARDNIAFERPVEASSTDYGSSADNAVDGKIDENGSYKPNMCVHTKKEPSFVKVDLEEEYEISEVKVAGRADDCGVGVSMFKFCTQQRFFQKRGIAAAQSTYVKH